MTNQSMWDSLFQPQMNNQNYTPMMDVKPLPQMAVPQQQPGAVANQQDGMMQLLTQLLAPQQQQAQQGPDLGGLLHQMAAAKDPVGYANKMSQLPSYMARSQSPFNTGFFGGNQVNPTAAMASQGPTAVNQWAQRGGVNGIDPDALRKMMGYR